MREAFRSTIKYCSEIKSNCIQYANLAIDKLSQEINVKYSKKPIQGTYFELLMLAKNYKLIPGQVYELTDYQVTIGSLANKEYFTDVQATAGRSVPLKIFLTAKSNWAFNNHVEGYFRSATEQTTKFEGDFIFDRSVDRYSPVE